MKPFSTCFPLIMCLLASQIPVYAETSTATQTSTQVSTSTAAPVLVSSQNQLLSADALKGAAGLTVASGASAIIDFGTSSTISLTGDINNSGSIYAISTNPAVSTAHLAATNIFNNQGALLSSVLSGANLPGMTILKSLFCT
ncbi:MAG: hypothetical protein K2X27_20620 [Candidatus Obscuribacterales bacterium]|nr:hypothetical protein [Candidatus Obscuribacterales bacterium]